MSMFTSRFAIFGYVAVGGISYYVVSPNTDYQSQMQKDQGVLTRDVSDAEKNNQMLMKKLQREAGLKPDKKS